MSITAHNLSLQRNDDEAVVDRRGTRCQQGTNFEQEDLEGTWRTHTSLFQQMIVLSTAFEGESGRFEKTRVGELSLHQ